MALIKNRFGRKITLTYLVVFVTIYIITGFYIAYTLENKTLDHFKDSLAIRTELLKHSILPDLIKQKKQKAVYDQVKELGRQAQARVTVIALDGTVLGDSYETWEQFLKMDNHASRPEIKTALNGQEGSIIRWSDTIHKKMFYWAVPLKENGQIIGVLRLSVPLNEIKSDLSAVRDPILIGSFAGIIIVLILGVVLGGSITSRVRNMMDAARRYARGDLSQKVVIESGDELQSLASTINRMATMLQERIREGESEKTKFATILENMAEGVIAVGHNNEVLLLNSSAKKIFDVGDDRFMGKSLLEITRQEPLDDAMRTAIDNQTIVANEIEWMHPDDRILKFHAIGIAKEPSAVCGFLVLHDVTEIRRLERMRREFVANVSHELRTPLTSLQGFIETLLHGAFRDPAQSEKFLKIMEEDTHRLNRLIQDLLELSKIESRKVVLNFQSLDLKAEVEKAISVCLPLSKEKGVSIENRLQDKKLSRVKADKDKLQQILINLLDNAIKFNRPQGRILVDAIQTNHQLQVIIEDTGYGVSEEDIPRVFERFFRADKARSRELGGTGLGLAIVKHLVEAHEGKVFCESQLGLGSKFSFTLQTV